MSDFGESREYSCHRFLDSLINCSMGSHAEFQTLSAREGGGEGGEKLQGAGRQSESETTSFTASGPAFWTQNFKRRALRFLWFGNTEQHSFGKTILTAPQAS